MRFTSRAERFAQALEGGPVSDLRTARLVGVVSRLDALPRPSAPAGLAGAALLVAASSMKAASTHAVVTTAATHAAHATAVSHVTPLAKLTALLPTWTPLATGALAVGVAFTGFSFTTSQALPGDTLYGVKTAVQDGRITFASGGMPTSEAHLLRADDRLADLVALQKAGELSSRPAAVASVLTSWTSDAKAGVDDLLVRAQAGSEQARADIQAFVVQSREGFAVVREALPAAAVPQTTAAVHELVKAVNSLAALPVTGTAPSSPVGPVGPATGTPDSPGAQAPTVPSTAASTAPGTTVPAPKDPVLTVPTTLPALPAQPSLPALVPGAVPSLVAPLTGVANGLTGH